MPTMTANTAFALTIHGPRGSNTTRHDTPAEARIVAQATARLHGWRIDGSRPDSGAFISVGGSCQGGFSIEPAA